MRSPAECSHSEFRADVEVHRVVGDEGPTAGVDYMADVRIRCVECGEPFRFLGVPSGLSFEAPMTSVDGLELHAPIEPEVVKVLASRSTFQVPQPRRTE